MMVYQDRRDAGRQLAQALSGYKGREDVIVLGIPRGGVVVGYEVALALRAPLDVLLARKLGVPGQEELAFGAVAGGGVRVLDAEVIEEAGLTPSVIEAATATARTELERREALYRGGRGALNVLGQVAIVVDDGIATGASVGAALRALRQQMPRAVVLAAPVAPMAAMRKLAAEADELVFLQTPASFLAIGQFYNAFEQVTDQEVIELLRSARPPDLPQPLTVHREAES